jgi:hypothetical protein
MSNVDVNVLLNLVELEFEVLPKRWKWVIAL